MGEGEHGRPLQAGLDGIRMIPVIIYDKCQCDPKKCTAKRMLKFGLGREAKTLGAIPSGSIVLSPFSDRALSPADIGHAHKGLVVMDLTWTNIDEFPRLRRVEERALPYLLASNPINWGRPMELNSAEAVMVGDRMDTDVISGMECGMSTVLVLSGISTEATLDEYAYRPSAVLDGVGDIVTLAEAQHAE